MTRTCCDVMGGGGHRSSPINCSMGGDRSPEISTDVNAGVEEEEQHLHWGQVRFCGFDRPLSALRGYYQCRE